MTEQYAYIDNERSRFPDTVRLFPSWLSHFNWQENAGWDPQKVQSLP
jgi:hypothetical protein